MLDVRAGAHGNQLGALPALAFSLALGPRGTPTILPLVERLAELIVEAIPIHLIPPVAGVAKSQKPS